VINCPRQAGFAEADMPRLTVRFEFTSMITRFDITVIPVTHIAFDVSWQETMSPFAGKYVYAVTLLATTAPFTIHCSTGVFPPFVRMADRVTGLPGQIGFADGDITIDAIPGWITVMVIGEEMAGLFNVQLALDVSWHPTTSPCTGR
jgi:hypothetical protein